MLLMKIIIVNSKYTREGICGHAQYLSGKTIIKNNYVITAHYYTLLLLKLLTELIRLYLYMYLL